MTTYTTEDRIEAAKMVEPKHTNGPWFVSASSNGKSLLIKPIPGQVVAECDELPEMKSNANLIAAAPELLETLQGIANVDLQTWDEQYRTPDDFLAWVKSRARHAIAKALGETK